jgi:methyl-accepting chemotaxis protein
MRNLADAASKTGDEVRVISGIAGHAKLPAPHATIEAARAGEACKRFAVAAGEVKNLAAQATMATDAIASRSRPCRPGRRERWMRLPPWAAPSRS